MEPPTTEATMRLPPCLRHATRAWVLLILALAIPRFASSLPIAPGIPEMSPALRGHLAQAAGDAKLPTWQREYMRRLVGGSGAAAGGPAIPAASAATAADGSWKELVLEGRESQSTIYDPVRDRLVVFGGHDATTLRPG